jgi:hypothetical protein
MSAPTTPYPHRCGKPLGRLRLQLPHEEVLHADGLWWPWGRDLTVEGPHLADWFPREVGRVDRLVYARSDWQDVADELFTSNGRIKAGFFPPTRGRGTVLVRLAGSGVLRLRVSWPEEDRTIS